MCVNCIRTQVDITSGITKQVALTWCKLCGRWLQPPKHWFPAELESKELLTHCVRRVRGLGKSRLVDAAFIWTEPHSMRLKVKMTVQAEVMRGALLQQSFVVDYVIERNACPHCVRTNTNPDSWVACVQVRQHVEHKRTFFFLEQLILRHQADEHCVNVKEVHNGIDFYFANRAHASRFVDFLGSVVPTRHRSDKQLVSHNIHTSTYNYKYTFSVEIAPVCKEDAVFLPPKLAAALGNLGPLVLVTRVGSGITLTDPATLRSATLDAPTYWRHNFTALIPSRQLKEYMVLDVEDDMNGGGFGGHGRGFYSTAAAQGGDLDLVDGDLAAAPEAAKTRASTSYHGRFSLAEATVAKAADLGSDNGTVVVKTHLGRVLRPGDVALGYDLRASNLTDPNLEAAIARGYELPDAMLVRKSYAEKRRKRRARGQGRNWRLRRLNVAAGADADDEAEGGAAGAAPERRARGGAAARAERRAAEAAEAARAEDLERFLEEIEEDPDVRARIALYRDEDAIRSAQTAQTAEAAAGAPAGGAHAAYDSDSDSGSDAPEVPLEELLEDLAGMQLQEPEQNEDDDALAALAGGMTVDE